MAVDKVLVSSAVAGSLPTALRSALTHFHARELPRLDPPVVVADAVSGKGSPDLGRLVVQEFAPLANEVQLVVPDRMLGAVLGRFGRAGRSLVPIDVRDRAERMTTVWLPASIVNAGTLVAVNDLSQSKEERPVVAIGVWSRFAGWRERLGTFAAKPEQALAADVALAVRPSLILLAANWRGMTVVIATSDVIAAELVGLAVIRARGSAAADEIGPWQDELVQRATEFELGVRLPDRLALRLVKGSTASNDAAELLEDVAVRLGVVDFAVVDI
jgi:hypothetical protein